MGRWKSNLTALPTPRISSGASRTEAASHYQGPIGVVVGAKGSGCFRRSRLGWRRADAAIGEWQGVFPGAMLQSGTLEASRQMAVEDRSWIYQQQEC